jgi:hypothetical protein
MTQDHIICDIEITPEMVEAGVNEFDAWESDHVFDEQPVADYARVY